MINAAHACVNRGIVLQLPSESPPAKKTFRDMKENNFHTFFSFPKRLLKVPGTKALEITFNHWEVVSCPEERAKYHLRIIYRVSQKKNKKWPYTAHRAVLRSVNSY